MFRSEHSWRSGRVAHANPLTRTRPGAFDRRPGFVPTIQIGSFIRCRSSGNENPYRKEESR